MTNEQSTHPSVAVVTRTSAAGIGGRIEIEPDAGGGTP
jgi:hypothetical protein